MKNSLFKGLLITIFGVLTFVSGVHGADPEQFPEYYKNEQKSQLSDIEIRERAHSLVKIKDDKERTQTARAYMRTMTTEDRKKLKVNFMQLLFCPAAQLRQYEWERIMSQDDTKLGEPSYHGVATAAAMALHGSGDKGVIGETEEMLKNASVTSIKLTDKDFEDPSALGRLIQYPNLRDVYVKVASKDRLHNLEAIETFYFSLPKNIRTLNLAGARWGDAGITKIIPHLDRWTFLEELNISNNDISDADMTTLAPHIPQSLFVLNIGGNKLGINGARALASRLVHFQHLKELNAMNCHLGDAEVAVLVPAFPSSLVTFVLKKDNLGETALKALNGWHYSDFGSDHHLYPYFYRIYSYKEPFDLIRPDSDKLWHKTSVFKCDFGPYRLYTSPPLNDITPLSLDLDDFLIEERGNK